MIIDTWGIDQQKNRQSGAVFQGVADQRGLPVSATCNLFV